VLAQRLAAEVSRFCRRPFAAVQEQEQVGVVLLLLLDDANEVLPKGDCPMRLTDIRGERFLCRILCLYPCY